jgi:hypothetical protein
MEFGKYDAKGIEDEHDDDEDDDGDDDEDDDDITAGFVGPAQYF